MAEIKRSGFDTYFADHTTGVYPQAASGVPFSAQTLQVTGDALADLYEDLAAEQKARLTYDNILRLVDDPMCAIPSNSCVNGSSCTSNALAMPCVLHRKTSTRKIFMHLIPALIKNAILPTKW
jgi:hypothetical protein